MREGYPSSVPVDGLEMEQRVSGLEGWGPPFLLSISIVPGHKH